MINSNNSNNNNNKIDENNEKIIVFFTQGDVNGDNIPDILYLIGNKSESGPFIKNITLLIQDGNTNNITNIPLNESSGYNPRIFLGDFTGNKINDILVSIDSGGSGGIMYHYIYSFENNIPELIFDFNVYNDMYNYEITYNNNYKVDVLSKINNNSYIIDISLKGNDYLNEIYDRNEKLKEPISGWVNPLSSMYPVDFDADGVYELLAYQRIAGRYNADGLGFILNTLKWNNNEFTLDNQNVAIFGYEQ